MKTRKSEIGKTRFTMWLNKETIESLVRVQDRSGRSSVAELIREAIEVYTSLMDARDSGYEFHFVNPATNDAGKIWLLPGPGPFRTAGNPVASDPKAPGTR